MKKINVLFVCMGNICRSPSAQGVFEKYVDDNGLKNQFSIDSAGTHSYHVGGKPDSRSVQSALIRDIDITHQRARKIAQTDFENFDYIVVMDNDNHMNVRMICPKKYQHKIHKMMAFSPSSKYTEVPDPYYGGDQGFELVLDLLENASIGLLQTIQSPKTY
ncbi:MAG: low molecular weight phosphotyrosine protein phosphatase [Proteobacteria bacterium]|nr:low molecular weight phosphotyrosine protein phosphatase [Pseudomonadota bacterium]